MAMIAGENTHRAFPHLHHHQKKFKVVFRTNSQQLYSFQLFPRRHEEASLCATDLGMGTLAPTDIQLLWKECTVQWMTLVQITLLSHTLDKTALLS